VETFPLFGLTHLAILASVPATAAALAWIARQSERAAARVRLAGGAFLLANTLAWYAYVLAQGWVQFPHGLPLELCDVTLWLTLAAVFTLRRWAFELAYYWGVAGTSMALLTPDLWEEFPSYPTVQFFVAHGVVVVLILTLLWGRLIRPGPRSLWRAVIGVNLWAAAVGAFNLAFDANYMYLCRKPDQPSLLDWFGPWPWYLLGAEMVGAVLFTLLWLPYRKAAPARGPARPQATG
jgi:hypothetical integral membrane protein (TIGR02206 family)